MGEEPDIDVEIVPAPRRDEEGGGERKRRKAGTGSKRRDVLEPATGRLLESKIQFLERYVGGTEGLAELIRVDAERLIHDAFLEYVAEKLGREGIDVRGHRASREIADLVERFWRDNEADIVDSVLAGFAGHLEAMGVERVADRFIRCWSGGDFHCKVDKPSLLEEFEDAGLEQALRIFEWLSPDLIDSIHYAIAEAGVSSPP